MNTGRLIERARGVEVTAKAERLMETPDEEMALWLDDTAVLLREAAAEIEQMRVVAGTQHVALRTAEFRIREAEEQAALEAAAKRLFARRGRTAEARIRALTDERDGLRDVRIPSMWKSWGEALNDLARLEEENEGLREVQRYGASICFEVGHIRSGVGSMDHCSRCRALLGGEPTRATCECGHIERDHRSIPPYHCQHGMAEMKPLCECPAFVEENKERLDAEYEAQRHEEGER